MMTFKEQMAKDLNQVFFNTEEFADKAVYTPVSGDPVSCDVVVNHDALIQADGYDLSMATLGTTVTAMVADVGTVNRGDIFTMADSTVYTVQRIERYSVDGHDVTVVVR